MTAKLAWFHRLSEIRALTCVLFVETSGRGCAKTAADSPSVHVPSGRVWPFPDRY